jgi:hypothetical protein
MPIRPPALDDRSFDDLVEELLARIPAHTPEWTNPRLGDPGRTIVELFAWLTDTLLYRANLIPEKQRLVFLKLLGVQMRSAIPARGLVSISTDDENFKDAVYLAQGATIKGPVNFETLSEITVLPVTGEGYFKRPITESERTSLADVLQGLQDIYQLSGAAVPYVTTPVFPNSVAVLDGFDLIDDTVDKCLWFALLAPNKKTAQAIRDTLGKARNGGQQLINVGLAPPVRVAALFEDVSSPKRVPYGFQICTGKEVGGKPEYVALDVISDSTAGLTRTGVVRLALPSKDNIGKLDNDVRAKLNAGLDDRPPRIDDPEKDDRLITWLRLRPTERLEHLSLSWAGINAVEVDQRQTLKGRVVAQSDGTADQEMQLSSQAIDRKTFQLQVESGEGYRFWTPIDDLAFAGRDDTVFTLDTEAGTIRFGDGIRGRIPEAGMRVRIAYMRAGGGQGGNLPAGSLKEIIGARDLDNNLVPPPKLKVQQALATDGGEDAESLAQAEKRIPALFRHRDRSVTEEDYKRLATDTPGVRLGRVEVLPRFKPQQRRSNVPGVVSVMVLPFKPLTLPPNPRPDRPIIEAVHGYLNARRPLTTELYVVGCEYIPVGISAGITIRDGFGRDTVINSVRDALRAFAWSLAPGGPEGSGWPLGRSLRDREVEVAVARVAGVNSVSGINLFTKGDDAWHKSRATNATGAIEIRMREWQLPELLTVAVVADDLPLEDLSAAADPFGVGDGATGGAAGGVAVPVVPEVC